METLARWCHFHRRLVLVLWLVGIVAVFGLGQAVKPHYRAGDLLPGTGSRQAADVLRTGFPDQAGDSDMIVWSVPAGSVRDADVQARMTAMLAQVRTLPHVRSVLSPYDQAGAADISANGRVAFAGLAFDQDVDVLPVSAVKKVVDTAEGYTDARVRVSAGGNAVHEATMTVDTTVSEIVGVLAAMLILLFAFHSLLSATLPLISALVSLVPSIALIGVVSRALVVPSFASSLTILLNLGIGIDYALFLVTRQRRALIAGDPPEEAIVATMRTAGRSVLYAGLVVCLALLSLLGMGIGYLSGMAAAAAIGIAFTMLAALTLIPALLGFFGDKVFSRRERGRMAEGVMPLDAASPAWARWSALVRRRPGWFAAFAAVLVVVLALPVFALRLGASDQGNDPTSSTTRRAYDDLAAGFGPGFNGPLFIVVSGPAAAGATDSLAAAVKATPGVAGVAPAQLAPSGAVGLIEAFPATAPQDRATVDLVGTLRGTVIPRTLAGTGAAAHIGGFTATEIDFTHAVKTKLPIFIVLVALLGAVLLTIAFRSLYVALLTGVMNLVAVGVCFGIVAAIFNWGWLGGLLGLGRPGPIDAFLPVFLFSILFGLSMDYQVFLIGRIHDHWKRTGDARAAVEQGQTETGRVITAAAGVMVLVFLSFATGNRLETLFGIGLGVTVLLDAFVVRTMLVPAILHLAGPRAWWGPRWLDRTLPRISMDDDLEPQGARR
ncbi:MAG: MMPL family transporter [Catenulispora sp.]